MPPIVFNLHDKICFMALSLSSALSTKIRCHLQPRGAASARLDELDRAETSVVATRHIVTITVYICLNVAIFERISKKKNSSLLSISTSKFSSTLQVLFSHSVPSFVVLYLFLLFHWFFFCSFFFCFFSFFIIFIFQLQVHINSHKSKPKWMFLGTDKRCSMAHSKKSETIFVCVYVRLLRFVGHMCIYLIFWLPSFSAVREIIQYTRTKVKYKENKNPTEEKKTTEKGKLKTQNSKSLVLRLVDSLSFSISLSVFVEVLFKIGLCTQFIFFNIFFPNFFPGFGSFFWCGLSFLCVRNVVFYFYFGCCFIKRDSNKVSSVFGTNSDRIGFVALAKCVMWTHFMYALQISNSFQRENDSHFISGCFGAWQKLRTFRRCFYELIFRLSLFALGWRTH